MADFDRESMMEMFTYEMSQLVDQLEQNVVAGESGFTMAQINEIFRVMHTVKGSAAMMMFDNIENVAHAAEDLFYYLRENNPQNVDYSTLTDRVLEANDFVKAELAKLESGSPADGDGTSIIKDVKDFLLVLKNGGAPPAAHEADASGAAAKHAETKPVMAKGAHRYHAVVRFEDGCEMENIRAYTLVHNMGDLIEDVTHVPDDIIDEEAIEPIRKNGFILYFTSYSAYNDVMDKLQQTVYLRELSLEEITEGSPEPEPAPEKKPAVKEYTNKFYAVLRFEDRSEMENVRAYTVVHNLNARAADIKCTPPNIVEESTIDIIRKDGFKVEFNTDMNYSETYKFLSETVFLKDLILKQLNGEPEKEEEKEKEKEEQSNIIAREAIPITNDVEVNEEAKADAAAAGTAQTVKKAPTQHVISVNVSKLDQLLNLMGELVIAEAMVSQNPELEGLELESFHKETRQLRKIINDVQDTVMSMRMVPLSTTFFKMHRLVRDMCKSLNKEANLEVIGEETEVDKNIIEHISDPLMHIIRNAVDHGIEAKEDRVRNGKNEKGTVYLEAKNSGGDVLIIIRDDGAGLDREKIMKKAKANGLLRKPENEYTDKEVYQFIMLPGFSTNDVVTSYSGRGVGMDVVSTNLEMVGGSVLVESIPGEGSTFTLKIPLTLAIIEGMTIKMGGAKYTIPIISIKESFKPDKSKLFNDPSGNEMIQVRGEVYNVVRLYEFFGIEPVSTDPESGIMIMLENGDQTVCLLADELIGEQQVVVKSMPKYIKKVRGLSGCTLLGNGEISLIIDVAGFFDK